MGLIINLGISRVSGALVCSDIVGAGHVEMSGVSELCCALGEWEMSHHPLSSLVYKQ